MIPKITTRRALEVVLSRCRLHRPAADSLSLHLGAEIAKETPQPTDDVDGLRALLAMIAEETRVDAEFPKAALIARLNTIQQWAEKQLNG